MQINVGTTDRIIRIAVGIVLIGLSAAGTIGPWGYIGIVPLATGIVRFCPGYALFRVNSCGVEKR